MCQHSKFPWNKNQIQIQKLNDTCHSRSKPKRNLKKNTFLEHSLHDLQSI